MQHFTAKHTSNDQFCPVGWQPPTTMYTVPIHKMTSHTVVELLADAALLSSHHQQGPVHYKYIQMHMSTHALLFGGRKSIRMCMMHITIHTK